MKIFEVTIASFENGAISTIDVQCETADEAALKASEFGLVKQVGTCKPIPEKKIAK